MIKNAKFTQYYTILCANLMTVTYGIAVGWPSKNLVVLQSLESPLQTGPLTISEASWIGSILCIGGALGSVSFGWLADVIGRKHAVTLICVPSGISWLLIEYGPDFYTLLTARFLIGFTGGSAFSVIPLVVTEIANSDIRGSLGSLIVLLQNAGTILGYILCNYTTYYTTPLVGISICTIFLIGYSHIPETPKYLIMKGKNEKALDSLVFFKKNPSLDECDLNRYSIEVGGSKTDSKSPKFNDFLEPAARKGLLIGIILMFVMIFSGVFTLANYYETIFQESGSSFSPGMSTIIVASIQFLGTYISVFTIERYGRRILILWSAYISALCLIVMGMYSFLKESGLDMTQFKWIPLASLSLLVFAAANGVTPVPLVILGEIFVQNVRRPMITFCILLSWIVTFFVVWSFPYLVQNLKMYGALWLFSTVEIISTTILACILPETKGLSVDKIVEILGQRI